MHPAGNARESLLIAPTGRHRAQPAGTGFHRLRESRFLAEPQTIDASFGSPGPLTYEITNASRSRQRSRPAAAGSLHAAGGGEWSPWPDPRSPVPNAAARAPRRCQRTPASSSTRAPNAQRGCARFPATAACSVRTLTMIARRSRRISPAADPGGASIRRDHRASGCASTSQARGSCGVGRTIGRGTTTSPHDRVLSVCTNNRGRIRTRVRADCGCERGRQSRLRC